MFTISIIYDSKSGHTEKMAEAIAAGFRYTADNKVAIASGIIRYF